MPEYGLLLSGELGLRETLDEAVAAIWVKRQRFPPKLTGRRSPPPAVWNLFLRTANVSRCVSFITTPTPCRA